MRSAGSSSPEAYPFQAFLDRLSAAAEDEPRLGAIALEIEALNSIFESSGRLHDRSRPVSWQSDAPRRSQGGSLNSDTTTSTHGAQEDFTSLSAAIKSLPAQTDSDREPLSASANISHFEELNLGIGPSDRLRYELAIPLLDEADAAWAEIEQRGLNSSNPAPLVRILVSLPPNYPDSSPPQLQLLGRYLGQYGIDAEIFGEVTRTYISKDGVTFVPGDVCVFEGVQHTLALTRKWYLSRLRDGNEGEKARNEDRQRGLSGRAHGDLPKSIDHRGPDIIEQLYEAEGSSSRDQSPSRPVLDRQGYSDLEPPPSGSDKTTGAARSGDPLDLLPSSLEIFSSQPITVSRSVFVGHACRVTDPLQVPLVIHQLLSDKKIARAAHPVIHAYRIRKAGNADVIIADNDDDGESAAGGRLAHLLQILDLYDTLVVVTRWYGGVLLGPERFKLINQAARDALDVAGFLKGGDSANVTASDRKSRR